MKKIGIFLDEIKDQRIDVSEKFQKVGFNTGNLLFWLSLKNLLDLDVKSLWYTNHPEELDLAEYKAFITTDLIWIRQGTDFSYLNGILDIIGELPLIPISIGLQTENFDSDFKLHPETVKVLKRISERCVMGVRGYYTAEILTKYGISNFEVIGCPSMYMPGADFDKINNAPKHIEKVTVNFETFYGELDRYKTDFLAYCAKRNFSFVEQAQTELSMENIPDGKAMSEIKGWIDTQRNCFFDIEEWREYMRGFDFSMGMRFHGNVMALWEGIPALFITCDSRTKELCEFFSLPSIDINEFDPSMPVEYYYRMADYSEFKRDYPIKANAFRQFLIKNFLIERKSNMNFKYTDFDSFQNNINTFKSNYHSIHYDFLNSEAIEIDMNRIFDLPEGRSTTVVNGVVFDLLFHRGDAKKLYVFLMGGILAGENLPKFDRWSYFNILDGSVLYIADPMYKKYKEQGLTIAWYYGDGNRSYLDDANELIDKIRDFLNLENKDIIFYGSSGGGYSSLYLSGIRENSKCIAINPQINLKLISNWDEGIKMQSITGADLSSDDPRNDLRSIIKSSVAERMIIVDNALSKEDMEQCKSLCDYLGSDFTYGLNKVSSNVLIWLYDAVAVVPQSIPHQSQEVKSILYSILSLLSIDLGRVSEYEKLYLSLSMMWSEKFWHVRENNMLMDKLKKVEETTLEKNKNQDKTPVSSAATTPSVVNSFNNTNKKAKVLYHAANACTFVKCLLHRCIYHPNDEAVYVGYDWLCKDYGEPPKYSVCLNYPPLSGPFSNYNSDTPEQSVKRIISFFDKLFAENDIDLNEFDKVYIGSYYGGFAIYANIKKIKHSIFEESAGAWFPLQFKGYDTFNAVIKKYSMEMFNNELVENRYGIMAKWPKYNRTEKDINFEPHKEIYKLSDEDKKFFVDFFDLRSDLCFDKNNFNVLLLTQWYTKENNKKWEDHGIIEMYRVLLDYYVPALSNVKLYIKPHPADPQKNNYTEIEGAEIIPPEKMSEIMGLIPNIHFDLALTVSSSSIETVSEFSDKLDSIGSAIINHYSELNKFSIVMNYLPQLIGNISVFGFGFPDDLYGSLSKSILFPSKITQHNPEKAGSSVVVIKSLADHLNFADISRDTICVFVNTDELVYNGNIQNEHDFEDLLNNSLVFKIITTDMQNLTETEGYFLCYCKDRSKLNLLKRFKFSKRFRFQEAIVECFCITDTEQKIFNLDLRIKFHER